MNYEERKKLSIDKRLCQGMLKEAEEILKNLVDLGGIADHKELSKFSKTDSCSYLLSELNGQYISIINGRVEITSLGRNYVANIKPEIETIDPDKTDIKNLQAILDRKAVKELKKELAGVV